MIRFLIGALLFCGTFASAAEMECSLFQVTVGVGVLKGHCTDDSSNEYKITAWGLVGLNFGAGEGTLSCTQEDSSHLQGTYQGAAFLSYLSGHLVAGGTVTPAGFSNGWDSCSITSESFGLGLSTTVVPVLQIDKF